MFYFIFPCLLLKALLILCSVHTGVLYFGGWAMAQGCHNNFSPLSFCCWPVIANVRWFFAIFPVDFALNKIFFCDEGPPSLLMWHHASLEVIYSDDSFSRCYFFRVSFSCDSTVFHNFVVIHTFLMIPGRINLCFAGMKLTFSVIWNLFVSKQRVLFIFQPVTDFWFFSFKNGSKICVSRQNFLCHVHQDFQGDKLKGGQPYTYQKKNQQKKPEGLGAPTVKPEDFWKEKNNCEPRNISKKSQRWRPTMNLISQKKKGRRWPSMNLKSSPKKLGGTKNLNHACA